MHWKGISDGTKRVSVLYKVGWTHLRYGVWFWSPIFRRACLHGTVQYRSIYAYQGIECLCQERWEEELSLAKWKTDQGDNCCPQHIKSLIILGEKKSFFPWRTNLGGKKKPNKQTNWYMQYLNNFWHWGPRSRKRVDLLKKRMMLCACLQF